MHTNTVRIHTQTSLKPFRTFGNFDFNGIYMWFTKSQIPFFGKQVSMVLHPVSVYLKMHKTYRMQYYSHRLPSIHPSVRPSILPSFHPSILFESLWQLTRWIHDEFPEQKQHITTSNRVPNLFFLGNPPPRFCLFSHVFFCFPPNKNPHSTTKMVSPQELRKQSLGLWPYSLQLATSASQHHLPTGRQTLKKTGGRLREFFGCMWPCGGGRFFRKKVIFFGRLRKG